MKAPLVAGLLDELPPDLAALLAPLRRRGFDNSTIEAELIREAQDYAAGRSRLNVSDWRTSNVPAILRLYRIILERLERRQKAGELAAREATGDEVQTPQEQPGVPDRRGGGYAKVDQPLIEEMHRLLAATPPQAGSVWEATDAVADRAKGSKQRDARRSRLAKRYRSWRSLQSPKNTKD